MKILCRHELDKNDIENADNLVLSEQQVPKHNNGKSTSCTEETLSCVDGTNQESPEKRQKVSDEASKDSNTESDVDINTNTQKNGSGKNELHVNREEDEPHVPIADDSQNQGSQDESGVEKDQENQVDHAAEDSTVPKSEENVESDIGAQESTKSDEALDQIIQDDKDNKGQLDGAADTNISESDLELKPASGSHDVLIGGALKDETNKAEDMPHLFDDDSVD